VQGIFAFGLRFYLNRLKMECMDKKTRMLFREIMREIGSKGGKIGGKRSLETMTAEERSARAKKASDAAAKKRTADRLARERASKRKPERAKTK
jgi:hypothetical protein